MQVILLEHVANLGELGQQVNVKSGYGRNFLIPQHKAVPATAINIETFETRRAELQGFADEKFALASSRAVQISALDITLTTKAGEEGKRNRQHQVLHGVEKQSQFSSFRHL